MLLVRSILLAMFSSMCGSQRSSPPPLHPFCITSKFCLQASANAEFARIFPGVEPFEINRPYCSCEKNCNEYSDCCLDKSVSVVSGPMTEDTTRQPMISPKLIACVRVHTITFRAASYLMVTHCPDSFSNPLLRELCEESNAELTLNNADILNLPATSQTTKRTYGNMYCGTCNGENRTDLLSWEYEFTCDRGPQPGPPPGATLPLTPAICAYLEATPSTKTPADTFGVTCDLSGVTRHCPVDYTGQSVYNCSYGAAHYVFSGDVTYKNEDCAKCNGVTEYECRDRGKENDGTITPGNTAFSVLVTVAGNCISAEGGSRSCPVSRQGFCSNGLYYNRKEEECKALCLLDEYFNELNGCEKVDCESQSISDFIKTHNVSTNFYTTGFLRSKANETGQYCFKCALIPYDLADYNKIGGIPHLDTETNTNFVCSSSFSELNVAYVTDVNSTEVILYNSLEGKKLAINKDNVLESNGTYFLRLDAPGGGIECEFNSVPMEAITNVSTEGITVRENLGVAFYRLPFYSENYGGSYDVCFSTPVEEESADCQFVLSDSPVNITNKIAYVEEQLGSYRLYLPGFFLSNRPKEVFLCQRLEQTWLHQYESTINLICYILSVAGLITTVFVYSCVKSLRNAPGIIIINQCVAFIGAYLFFAFVAPAEGTKACLAVAILTHFFFLAAFAFTVIYALSLAQSIFANGFSNANSLKKKVMLTISGWLFAAILIGAFILIHTQAPKEGPTYADSTCFVSNSFMSLRNYFYIPVIVMLSINTVTLTLIVTRLILSYLRMRSLNANKSDKGEVIRVLLIATKLQISFGLLWVIAVVALFTQNVVAIAMFSIINSLQGLFLFLTYVCNARVLGKVKTQAASSGTFSTALKSKPHGYTAATGKDSIEMNLTAKT